MEPTVEVGNCHQFSSSFLGRKNLISPKINAHFGNEFTHFLLKKNLFAPYFTDLFFVYRSQANSAQRRDSKSPKKADLSFFSCC